MRILVHDFSGHPFQIQLSRALAARGDDVLHAYCGDILTPKGPLARRPEDPVGFRVRDLGRGREFPKYQLGRRVIDESRYARRFAACVREFRPDVVLLSNDPVGPALQSAHRESSSHTYPSRPRALRR